VNISPKDKGSKYEKQRSQFKVGNKIEKRGGLDCESMGSRKVEPSRDDGTPETVTPKTHDVRPSEETILVSFEDVSGDIPRWEKLFSFPEDSLLTASFNVMGVQIGFKHAWNLYRFVAILGVAFFSPEDWRFLLFIGFVLFGIEALVKSLKMLIYLGRVIQLRDADFQTLFCLPTETRRDEQQQQQQQTPSSNDQRRILLNNFNSVPAGRAPETAVFADEVPAPSPPPIIIVFPNASDADIVVMGDRSIQALPGITHADNNNNYDNIHRSYHQIMFAHDSRGNH
jgi:hypothetical protein